MNLFDKSKFKAQSSSISSCHHCGKEFLPDKRNVNRGWGMFCGKSCAVSFRNKLGKLKNSDLVIEIRDLKLRKLGI